LSTARTLTRSERLLRTRSRVVEAGDLLMGPIRGEPLGSDHLAERARSLARSQHDLTRGQSGRSWRSPVGLSRLDETRRIVTAARAVLSADPKLDVGPAGEWLLDNFHVIEEQLREIRESLPKSYYRELPTLASGLLSGEPRIFELAITLIAHTEGRVALAEIELFVSAVQEVSPLSLGELWALPAMMRLALIENIRRMTLRTVRRLDELEDADEWAARIETASETGERELRETLGAFVGRGQALTPTFVSRLLHQLRVTSASSPPLAKLERWIAETELSAEDAGARSSQQLALTQMMMANSITSLVTLSRLDWIAFVERQSVTEQALRADPSGFYPKMTASTRDAYRHQVERIAKRSKMTELQVASCAVELASELANQELPSAAQDRRAHVGHFLIDAGQPALERAAGYRSPVRERLHRFVRRHPHELFMGGIAVTTALCIGALVAALAPTTLGAATWVALFALLPVTDLAVNVINQLITSVMAPHRLPKLELLLGSQGLDTQTAIVVPVLLGDVTAVDEALHNLEVQYLSNPEPYLRFVLLGDFTDAPSEHEPTDSAIVAAASEGIGVLNARYPGTGTGMFHLLHRPRQYDSGESCWMGWERKRGKLAQLNGFLRGHGDAAFSHVVGDSARLRQTRFVITLDADTMLPAESAAELIGTLAHPLNRPVFDPATGHVVRGYGILQPRVVVSLPSAQASRFAALYSGRPGMDPYTTAVSDLYQDLYGEGSYSGKGIYDVDAFERATHGRFPEHALLSHDLIEGSFARAGLVTDVNVYDDYPARYLTFTRRKHRWIRGDWQLLPWLRRRVPTAAGQHHNTLSPLARFKILDNLRRSVTEIAQLSLFVAGWTVLPGGPTTWTFLAAGIVAAPWLFSLSLAALRPPFDKSLRAYYAALGRDAFLGAQQFMLALVFLPHQAWTSGDAIARTLVRLGITRKHLLEWRTAEHTERAASGSARESLRHMAPATALAVTLLAAAWTSSALASRAQIGSAADIWPLLSFLLLWLSAPALAQRISRPHVRTTEQLPGDDLERARGLARLHWEFFERFTTAETAWLTPDNFQDDPAPVVALRTSPTNIGLQLLATVSAHDLGFISLEQMLVRLGDAFDTLDGLARHEGHLFNWYSLETRAVLEPAYVSTVDSGNLAGHCIALRQACLAFAAEPSNAADAPRLVALAARAFSLCSEMNFAFLYDRERKLFAIGYQVGTRSLDSSYYDLLASESRLASFVAIAKNEAPVEHWFRLGRSLTREAGQTALASWSGSMFEYLMPSLVMRSYEGTLLEQTQRGAVQRQIAYGKARGVPWGVSESAYNVRDRHSTYQYRAFGVPDLALKRGLQRDLVIAPYASMLALAIEPRRAMANLRLLASLGAEGPYGLRDALDYTRPASEAAFALVSTYMAHHIGMSLVALTNVLKHDLWQQRFHADPLVQSAELLLQERVPRRAVLLPSQLAQPQESSPRDSSEAAGERSFDAVDVSEPHVALLGQLPYTLMISHCGSGYSRFEDLAVTRFRADGTRDDSGQFCYLKDVTSGRVWSAAHQPVCAPADYYRAVLAPHRVTFRRLDDLIETTTEIAVVPEDAAEIRRVTVTNRSHVARVVELTSYGEIVLAPPDADRAHPAFSNLFVETEWHAWCSAITATRRPRSAKDRSLVSVHLVDADASQVRSVSCETDRARFLGRGRSVRSPLALDQDGALSGTTGAVLDPVFALRVRVELEPGQSAQVAFTTLVAPTREAAFALADRYHHPQAAQRALDLALTSTQVELRELQVSPAEAGVFQELAGALLYATPALRASPEELSLNRGSQPLLWAQGISGDWPIVLAIIDSQEGLKTLRQLFAAHHYWRRRGMVVDLVVLNLQPSLYLQELTHEITAGLFGSSDSGMLDRPGGVFMLRRDLLTPETLLMLRTTARVHVQCDGRLLDRTVLEATKLEARAAHALEARAPQSAADMPLRDPQQAKRKDRSAIGAAIENLADHARAALREHDGEPQARAARLSPVALESEPLRFDNGYGGLTTGGAYRIHVQGGKLPPAPWANVIANPFGGFVVSERGGGFAWARSSYFFRLTPWHNDPVGDPPGDVVYLRDEHTGELWSATPAPLSSDGSYVVEHDAGSSSFAHEHGGIATQLTLGLADDSAVKISRLRVTNTSARARRISVTAYVEWTLGVLREHSQHQVRTSFDAGARTLFARNHFNPQFAGWVAFCTISEPVTSHSGSRRSFLGRNGQLAAPLGLRASRLDGQTGAGIDPCAALQCVLSLAPGQAHELSILLGAAPSEADARAAIESLGSVQASSTALSDSSRAWSERLSVIKVRTPEPAFDAMLNRWTLYQALACRMWARSALYQSSGAYGFRDQLQDVMAFVYAEPALSREHILRAAARQFVEGDVQHWWHEGSGQGVRTRFSDDLAWLPYVVAHYVRSTGDASVLEEQVPFLAMRALAPDEHEIYAEPQVSSEHASLYEHCVRALRKACTVGAHGLPRMGSGDWNDGMNLVGAAGQGESIWLAWFLIGALKAFEPHARTRDAALADELLRSAEGYAVAADTHGWDGAWYRRAYFDDGSPLGSSESDECRIDSIAQSWSVISGAGTAVRQAQALASLDQHLVDEQARLVLLLTPPFDKTAHDPGYIKGYLPGVRENGAQYTHAALWAVLAFALRRDGDRAFQLYQMVNPLTHTQTPAQVAVYKVEPYVVAADVYTAAGQRGRGGWTWYTGSASWMYRVGLEAILGFDKRGDTLHVQPSVPKSWPGFSIEYRHGTSLYVIDVSVTDGEADPIVLDGTPIEGTGIPLRDDGQRHQALVSVCRHATVQSGLHGK
jgi:cyclic beta-1,2-glucan synthetase